MRLPIKILLTDLFALLPLLASGATSDALAADSARHRPASWRIGAAASGAFVPGTDAFLRGETDGGERINKLFGYGLRGDFAFSPASRLGALYPGVRQGLGIDLHTFGERKLMGRPTSLFVYQTAPIARLGERLTLGYEWQFGAAYGWHHYARNTASEGNGAVSTSTTAHMGLALRLAYRLTPRLELTASALANHFSNGNTSWPNGGVNSVGLGLGLSYALTAPETAPLSSPALRALGDEADRGAWLTDIVAYGSWRRRAVTAYGQAQLCPGRFGVAGVQVMPLRQLNRHAAVGVSVDAQYDESSGIAPYWVEGTSGADIKFYRPPFGKQLSVGLAAHAELTAPIFVINVGLGYDVVCPEGDKPFYQSLALKTFVTRRLFINTGYRLRRFRDPQNLMIGLGVRL
jgi:hypothetical protein